MKNEYDDSKSENDPTVDVDIAVHLKLENKAFRIEKHVHNYPHCWRTDKPVLYYPLDSWFVRTTAMKDKMIELNNTINWKPASTGPGGLENGWKTWWTGTCQGPGSGEPLFLSG